MAALKAGIPAQHKYNPIKYSFVRVAAGDQHVLTSDPWSYLASYIQALIPKKKGTNKQNLERAFHYARLAEDFFKASDTTPLPAKGTLAYYSMLNLAKCYLSCNGLELEKTYEHHGLQLPQGQKGHIEAKKPDPSKHINIFAEFCKHLGTPISTTTNFSLESALSHVPEIHGLYSSVTETKRKLLPVSIDFLVTEDKKFLFTELSYKKEQENKVDCTKFHKGERLAYFKPAYTRDNSIVYRSASRKTCTKDNISTKYLNFLHEYDRFNITPILTRQGYRYYVDLKPGEFPSLAYSLAAMFYLGSAARYRPVEMEAILKGKLRPLITELISLTPKQFLYRMVSHITQRECVIPLSKL
jgi:hypothetical protein